MDLRHRRDARGDSVQKKTCLCRRIAFAGFADRIGLEPDKPSQKREAVTDPMIGFGGRI